MATVTLTVEIRAKGGNSSLRELRKAELVPGVFYGPATEPVLLAVQEKEIAQKMGGAGGSQLVQFACSEAALEGKMALLKEVQSHPVTGNLLHVDFYAVDETRSVKVRAPLNFLGKAEGVTAGGILQPLRRDLRVECLPSNIPSAVDVDVSGLNIHDTIHVEDLVLPEGVAVIADTNFAIVTVLPPTVEVVEAPAEAVAEGEAPPTEEAPEAAEQPAQTGEEA